MNNRGKWKTCESDLPRKQRQSSHHGNICNASKKDRPAVHKDISYFGNEARK